MSAWCLVEIVVVSQRDDRLANVGFHRQPGDFDLKIRNVEIVHDSSVKELIVKMI
jgi:hypothetical protein